MAFLSQYSPPFSFCSYSNKSRPMKKWEKMVQANEYLICLIKAAAEFNHSVMLASLPIKHPPKKHIFHQRHSLLQHRPSHNRPNRKKKTSMLVVVRTLSGKSIPIKTEGSDTVGLLKCKILEKEGILPEQQRLIFTGKSMNDEWTLNDYNVTKEATIYLVLRLPGGASPGHGGANVDGPLRRVCAQESGSQSPKL